jgi:hypothetical protein
LFVIGGNTCHAANMVDTSYRVIPRAKHRFDVEMARPGGSRKTIEGFVSEHEANAWIVQTQRMIRAANLWSPLAPRKPASAQVPSVLPLPSSEQQRLQNERNHAANRRANVRAARERIEAKS